MKNEFKKFQPLAYQTLKNAIDRSRIAHAYLFHGPKGSGKLKIATLFAQSLVCEHGDPFACGTCAICQRIQHQQYHDVLYIDGSMTSIKKKDILSLQEQFSKTALEKGKKIYIINAVENSTTEALNSLLKFLEEPSSSDITAILISEQMDRVLPTIVSRCQLIPFRSIGLKDRYDSVKMQLEPLDAYLLANLYHQSQRMIEMQEDEVYQHSLYLWKEMLKLKKQSIYDAHLFLITEAFPTNLKKHHKQVMKYLIEFLTLYYQDLKKKNTLCVDEWYQTEIQTGSISLTDARIILEALMQAKDKLNHSINLPLLLDQLMSQLK